MVSLALDQHPCLEDQDLDLFWLLIFDMSDMVALLGAYAPASINVRVTGVRKPPQHDNAVVHVEDIKGKKIFWLK
jgi:hypothetical protein